MPLTTDELALPYPETTDDAEVPADLLALANRLEAILTAGHDSLINTGDFKTSARSASHGRWLLCDGSEKTQAEIESALSLDSGDGADIVALLGVGGASIYGAAAGSKVKLPDPRSKFILHAGPGGGGLSARVLGAAGGAESVTLTADQSGVRNHTHGDGTLAVDAHAHGSGTLACASHSHADGTLAAASHTHALYNSTEGATNAESRGTAAGPYFCAQEGHHHSIFGNVVSAGADVTGSTAATAPAVGGSTADATAGVSGSTGNPNGDSAGGEDAESAHPNMPPFVVLGSLFIRV